MGKRKRIGLFFSYSENWIGGSYYIINLIEALKLLPDDKRPEITIFYYQLNDLSPIQKLNYPGIDFKQVNKNNHIVKRAIHFFGKKVLKTKIFTQQLNRKVSSGYYDAIFPTPIRFDHKLSKKIIYWIPDFQYLHLPQFFLLRELEDRKQFHAQIGASGDTVIFSSYDAQKDFNTLCVNSKAMQHVVQFAVTHPTYNDINFSDLAAKYKLPPTYFFCPNQFWAHKNQKVILEAVLSLKKDFNRDIKVVFSGKAHDHRNASYFDDLNNYIKENGIEDNISFLGFIDRKEQLLIMKNALAVLQPSLFEGWSTVVEDAKLMNQNVIASNLNVHKEQLGDNAVYFDPNSSASLVTAIQSFEKKNVEFNYDAKRLEFAYNFLNVLNE
jgi:glycosyltransferase involved in cell wall biosynthesis